MLKSAEDEFSHDDSTSNDVNISYEQTHDDTCVLKEDFNSYQVKCIK